MHLHDKAFYASFFFIAGVAASSFGVNIWLSLIVGFAAGMLLLSGNWKSTAVLTLIILLGSLYFNFYNSLRSEIIPFGEKVNVEGVVFREPKHGIKSQQLDVKLRHPNLGEIRIYTQTLPRFEYGDVLGIEGVIDKSPSGRLNIASFPKISVIEKGEGGSIKSALFRLRGKMISNLNAVLAPRYAALISGILFGERAEFSDDFEEAMRLSGTTHIVALSGYNVAIIGITLSTLLSYFMRRKKAFYISVAAIFAFVVMTGAQASVVRAGIMGTIALLAERRGRIYSFRNAVVLTATAMLIFNPNILASDIGFQLSFAALLGIVYLYPLLKKVFKLSEEEGILGWRRNFFQTLSAQVAVAPIILTSFGYFSPTALMANVLILEFIPLTMLFGFITAVLGFFSYGLSLVTGWLTSLLLGYEILVINLFSFNLF